MNLEEKNFRTITTSARYLPINRAVKSFSDPRQVESIWKKIQNHHVKSEKSLYFYFLMLTYTFGKTGINKENYNVLSKQIYAELEKY